MVLCHYEVVVDVIGSAGSRSRWVEDVGGRQRSLEALSTGPWRWKSWILHEFFETKTETCFWRPNFPKLKPWLFFRDQILRKRNLAKIGKSLESEKFWNRNVNLWQIRDKGGTMCLFLGQIWSGHYFSHKKLNYCKQRRVIKIVRASSNSNNAFGSRHFGLMRFLLIPLLSSYCNYAFHHTSFFSSISLIIFRSVSRLQSGGEV